MLAGQITLPSSPNQGNSFASMLLEPLCSLFATLSLCFQQLGASSRKTPGWGVCRPLTAPCIISVPCKSFRINTCKSVSKQATLTGSVDILGTEGDFLADKPGRMMFSTQAGGRMPEIGLLPFARVALDVATTVLPTYRSRFSKHQFTQPQLLAILCLMRYEDWTFREAEVRLRE